MALEEITVQPVAVEVDYNHPLYLHASDGPGSMSVGIQLTGMENYMLWSRAMKVALLGRNKLGFVDGSVKRETYGSAFAPRWDRCNGNVSRDLLSGVLFRSNAHMVWTELEDRFNKTNGSKLYALHKEIFTMCQGTASVSIYYSRRRDLWDEYDSMMLPPTCDCEKAKDFIEQLHYQLLLQFLMGLNEGNSQARSQILMKTKVLNVNQAYTLIVQDESQKIVAGNNHVANEDLSLMAFYTARTSGQG